MAAFQQTEHDLDPARVREMVEAGEAQLVDVREPYENEAGRIAGSLHIEMERLAARSEEIEKDRPVVFHCRVGHRSALVTEAFRHAGYDAYNLAGGIQAWADAGLPIEPADGRVADH
jgi:adenylyltransferase/sulfurtransferase